MSQETAQRGQPAYAEAQAYLDLLPRLEEHSRGQRMLARALPWAALLIELPLLWLAWQRLKVFFFRGPGGPDYAFWLVLALLAFAALWTSMGWGVNFPVLDAQLVHSGLSTRLALGAYAQDRIFDFTHPLLRWLLPRGQVGGYWPTLLRISGSLEWYLGPPRRHMRLSWQSGLATGLMVLVFGLVFPLLAGGLGGFQSGMPMGILPTVMLLQAPFMYASFIHMQLRREASLLRYLRASLPALALAVVGGDAEKMIAPAASAGYNEPGAPETSTSLHLILNQLEQDMVMPVKQQTMMPNMITMQMGFLTFPMLIPMLLNTVLASSQAPAFLWMFLPLCIALAVSWIPGVIGRRYKRGYAPRLRSQLAQSELALRLASGELKEDSIFDYAPLFTRSLLDFPRMPKGYASELRRVLWRVAFNLEWYLGPPRRVFRRSWVYWGIAVLVFVCCIAFPMWKLATLSSAPMPGSQPLDQGPLLAIGTVVASILGAGVLLGSLLSIEAHKTQAWTEELPGYLRGILALDD